jgi:hypothetical protein
MTSVMDDRIIGKYGEPQRKEEEVYIYINRKQHPWPEPRIFRISVVARCIIDLGGTEDMIWPTMWGKGGWHHQRLSLEELKQVYSEQDHDVLWVDDGE